MKEVIKNKGITLVALIITIIILLILAGITISQLAGNGIFDKVKQAKQKYENSQELENSILGDYENKINIYTRGGSNLNYSTSQQDTGMKWMNGETIFQKTVDIGSGPNKTTKNVAHGIENLDYVIDFYGTIVNKDGSHRYITGEMDYASSAGVMVTINKTNITVYSRTTDFSSYSGYITMLYTVSNSEE